MRASRADGITRDICECIFLQESSSYLDRETRPLKRARRQPAAMLAVASSEQRPARLTQRILGNKDPHAWTMVDVVDALPLIGEHRGMVEGCPTRVARHPADAAARACI